MSIRWPTFIVDSERLLLVDFDWGGKIEKPTFPDAELQAILRSNRQKRMLSKERDDIVLKDAMKQVELPLRLANGASYVISNVHT